MSAEPSSKVEENPFAEEEKDSDQRRKPKILPERFLYFFSILAATAFLEYELAIGLIDGQISIWWALAWHGLFSLLCLCLMSQYAQRRQSLRWMILLWCVTLFCGVFGWLITAFAYVFYVFYSKTMTDDVDWLIALFPKSKRSKIANLHDRLISDWDDTDTKSDMVPLLFVAKYGNVNQKRKILGNIGRHFKGAFVPVLNATINDPSNAIRVQTAATLAKIERDFSIGLHNLEKAFKDTKKAIYQKKLGNHLRFWSHSKLVDQQQKIDLLKRAQRAYENYLATAGTDLEVSLSHAEISFDLGDVESSLATVQKLLRLPIKERGRAIILHLKILFSKKEFAELRKWSQIYLSEIDKDDAKAYLAYETCALWGKPSHESVG